jgi:RHS repeat-associated protein
MSGRFMIGIAEGAAKDFGESAENAARTISKKLISDVADTEEGNVERTLGDEAERTANIQQVMDRLSGQGDAAVPSIGESTPGGLPAEQGGAGDVPKVEGGDFGGGDAGGQGSEGDEQTPDCNDPIDPISGQLITAKADVELAGVLALVLRRAYASGYRHGQFFGPGWSSTLDQRLVIDPDGIHYLGDDAQILNYPMPSQPGQQVLPAAGARWPLTWDRATDAIEITDPARGLTRHFAPPRSTEGGASTGGNRTELRHLVRVTDRNGNWMSITRDADDVPTRVDHSGGYQIEVESSYRGGGFRIEGLRLVGAAHSQGTTVVGYGYDPSGRLVEVLDGAGAAFVYEYDADDRITAWIDKAGYRYGYSYDEDGRIAAAGGEDGTLSARFEYDREARCTRVIDSYESVTEYWYDEHNHLIKTVDPLGNATEYRHDEFGRLIEHTDPLGNTTRFTRDEFGNVRELRRADGSRVLAEYNAFGQPVRVTAPSGAVSVLEYDARGNLTSVTDPSGAVVRHTYDERGALVATTDALGHTTTVGVDRAGLPLTVTDPLGAVWSVARDACGRVVRSTDPLGNVTTTEYDGDGRPIARTTPDGAREQWEYDARGNLARHTDAAGFQTLFEFGPFHRILAKTDPDGSRYEFTHDRELRLTAVANPARANWTYEYDAAGNLVAEQDFDGRRLTYGHDAAGRLVQRVNGAGERIDLVRDVLGHVVEQRAGGELFASFEYNIDGALARATADGVELEYTRDATGRVVAETVDGRTLTRTYDALGNRISRITPTGRVSTWQYDVTGRPQWLNAGDQRISFGHDAAGRETHRWLSASTALTHEWDQLGRLTARRILAVTGPEQARVSELLQERTWTYRADGNPDSVTDAHGTHHFALDTLGRVTAVTAETWSEQYAYDAVGNLTQASDSRAGDAATAGPRELAGTLLRRAGRTSYEYDAQARLVRTIRRTISGARKVWSYSYDAHDRLTEAVTPEGERWRYRYDPLGRRIAKQLLGEDGAVLDETRFTWDGAVLVEQERVRAGSDEVTAIAWDYEPGSWTPLAQDRRTYYAQAPQQVIDRQFHAIVTDLVGTPTELVTSEGAIAWRRSADLWGNRLPGAGAAAEPGADAADCPLGFPGQYHDRETGLEYNYKRYYDPETGRYATPDPLGLAPAPNHHGYVVNPMTWLDPLGLAGDATGSGADPGDFEEFYRTMSKAHYEALQATGRLPATSETFVSPTQGFSEDYQGVLVKFRMQPGTRDKLAEIGVRDTSAATSAEFPDMPTVGKGWTRNNAFFKGEGEGHVNIGLGKGKALNLFNDNIADFEKVKEIC